MAQKEPLKIVHRDGHVMYAGHFDSKRELIAWIIKNGGSLAGANLNMHDLSHLNLDHMDFTGADLTGAKLLGSKAAGAIFNDTLLIGTKAEGMTAPGAKFIGATIAPRTLLNKTIQTSFDGSKLTYSVWDGASITEASLEGCGLAGASFDMTEVTKCSFRGAFAHNTQWGRALLRDNNFENAELHTSLNGNYAPRRSMPDRTKDAIAISNNYKNAILDNTTSAFRLDHTLGKVARQVAWGASAAVMLLASTYLPLEPNGEWLGKVFGQGTVMVSAFFLLNLVKEKVGERVEDFVKENAMKVSLAVRAAAMEFTQRGGNLIEAVATITRGSGSAPFLSALAMTAKQAEEAGIPNIVKSIMVNDTSILLCDKGHMAMALEMQTSSYGRTHLLKKDMIFTRVKHEDDGAPSIIKLFAGGGMAAFWTHGNQVETVREWGPDEMEPLTWPIAGRPAQPRMSMDAMQARQLFEEAVVQDHLPNAKLTYDRMTDQIRAGMDGSIIITRQKTQLMSRGKQHGPIWIDPNGTEHDKDSGNAIKIQSIGVGNQIMRG